MVEGKGLGIGDQGLVKDEGGGMKDEKIQGTEMNAEVRRRN